MSHEMRTVFVSSGLMVGLNIAPPATRPNDAEIARTLGRGAGQTHCDENCGKKAEFHRSLPDDVQTAQDVAVKMVQPNWNRPPCQFSP